MSGPLGERRILAKTIIGEDLHISGNLTGAADIDLAGRVDGDITAASLDILTSGQVDGVVSVTHAHVRGHMSGSISATSVEIHTGAVCEADITAEELETRRGATIKGQLTISSAD